jgi:hypothetical protein
MTSVSRLVARYKVAGFIPDKFWKSETLEFKRLLEAPLDDPQDVVWGIQKIKDFFGLFKDRLERYGLNRHAEDTVKFRIEMLSDGQLSKISESFEALERELSSHPYPIESPTDELHLSLATELKEQFKKTLPTLGKALKSVWSIQPGSVRALAERLIKKATPEELQALERVVGGDFSSKVLDLKYGFFRRVGLEAQVKKLVTRTKADRDFLKWFFNLRDVLAANYGEEGMEAGFDDFMIGNLKAVILDTRVNLNQAGWYAKRLTEAQRLLQQKGFGKLWYGVLFIKSNENEKLSEEEMQRYRELGYLSLENRAGLYHSGEDIVKLMAPPNASFVSYIVHEMGHRYWFKFMTPEKRARFNGLVRTNPSKDVRDFPSGPDEDGVEKPVAPVSDYGKSSIEEAFAEAFMKYVMEEDMDRDQLESMRSVLARIETIDEQWVERLRKDFLTLVKNLPRVKTYAIGSELREAFKLYRSRFRKFFFDDFLNARKNDGDASFEGMRKEAWDFYSELEFPLYYADKDWSEQQAFHQFEEKAPAWEKRLRTKAQAFWRTVKEQLSYRKEPKIDIELPDRDRLVLEGFQIEIVGYEANSTWQDEALSKFKEALRQYRRKAAQRLPWLLKRQLPLVANFNSRLNEGGLYEVTHITIAMSALNGEPPEWGVHMLAHEMGHHMYKSLSHNAQAFWDTAIRQDYGPLDVQDLLAKWPANIRWASDFVQAMALKDPVLALQVDVLSSDTGGSGKGWTERSDFEGARVPTIAVPQHPITGYAGKNPEESFCEAIGRLVGYGPATVLPQVRQWLDIVIPGEVKTARSRLVARYRASQ